MSKHMEEKEKNWVYGISFIYAGRTETDRRTAFNHWRYCDGVRTLAYVTEQRDGKFAVTDVGFENGGTFDTVEAAKGWVEAKIEAWHKKLWASGC